MKIAVVGAGPAGAHFARLAAAAGAEVTVFDASHPREKPCGGGLTAKALACLPDAPPGDPLPARFVSRCRFESGAGEAASVALARPVAVCARRDLDAWLLRRAVEAGAAHEARRVTSVTADGDLRAAGSAGRRYDLIVGADGAGSLVRRTFLSPTPTARRFMAAGWYARGTSEMLVQFLPGLEGYLWLFPRPDHVGVGICAPLGSPPTRDLLRRLESEIARAHPALRDDEAPRYAHTIPSPGADPATLAEVAGTGWALLGDAAALCDPITGEGIYYALRSAEILNQCLASRAGVSAFPKQLQASLGDELLRAARLRERFYAPGFARRMVSYAARSGAVREVLGDLVLGDQGYGGLKGRLLRVGPRFVLDSVLAPLRRRL
jgi:flavin-dependent dehydrogenase